MTPEELAATVDTIAAVQQADGMIPWFEGGHGDPWNHVEAAMALDAGGRRAEAEAAYGWLAATQRPDGAWHQYYRAGRVTETTLDANVTAYVATGVWHHFLATADAGFLDAMWPVVEAAVGFVLGLQTPRGEVLWARHADGTPWSFALLTASSSTFASLRCACAVAAALGQPRPEWELAADALGRVVAARARGLPAQGPLVHGLVLPGAGRGGDRRRRRRPPGRRAGRRFVMDGLGVRCVADKDWVTAAETAECALAHLAAGEVEHRRPAARLGRPPPPPGRQLVHRHGPSPGRPFPGLRTLDLQRGRHGAGRHRPGRRRPARAPADRGPPAGRPRHGCRSICETDGAGENERGDGR